MKKLSIIFVVSILFSCNKSFNSSFTFEQIENEFKFPKSLTEASKKNILLIYGSIENYYEVLKELEANKNSEANSAENFLKSEQIQNSSIWTYVYLRHPDWGEDKRLRFGFFSTSTILDKAEENGLTLPYSCRAGVCTTCLMKLKDGISPSQADQSILSDCDLYNGWVVSCVAHPMGSCLLETHMEEFFVHCN